MDKKPEYTGNELRLYRDLVESMVVGVFLVRASDGIIVYANPAIERIFGYDPNELPGKRISTVNAPTEKSPEQVAREIMESLHTHGTWHGEVQNLKKDGTIFWSLADVATFEHPEHGEIWAATHQDITEKKRAEEALRESEDRYRTVAHHTY